VESIIRDNPTGSLVVRGGIASVLPTINSLRDLRNMGWRNFPKVSIMSPSNTLTSFLPSLSECEPPGGFYETLLEKSYGIQVYHRPTSVSNASAFLVNTPGTSGVIKEAVEQILKGQGNKLSTVLPREEDNSWEVSRYVNLSVFTSIYEGNNIFFSSHIEELLWDYCPEQIVIIGSDPVRTFYSAIGAVDWFILYRSRYQNPEKMQIWDLVEIGKHVVVITPETDCSNNGNSNTIKDSVLEHMRNDLQVNSTDDDFRFTPVAGHKIAIDII
jgi:hypothetical protein